MINLGFTTAGLFFIAGFLYTRQQTTQLPAFGGMAKHTPLLAAFFLLIGLASIGLPGTNGFVGEFLILLGAFKAYWVYGAIAVTGVITGAAYFLWYYERAILGPVGKAVRETIGDLHLRETVIAVALSIMILWIGLYPAPFLRMMNGSVQALVDRLDHGTVAATGLEWPEVGGKGQGAEATRAESEAVGEPIAARLSPLAMDRR
jgi:NADH-quinone oxidoreductase subunit M